MSYIKYHTGLDAIYLPTWCGDKVANRDLPQDGPARPEILLWIPESTDAVASVRADTSEIYAELVSAVARHSAAYDFRQLKELYPHYEYTDIQAHRCIVMIPSQVSVLSFFEFYRLNVPVFVPSKRLLISWHLKYNLLRERIYVSG